MSVTHQRVAEVPVCSMWPIRATRAPRASRVADTLGATQWSDTPGRGYHGTGRVPELGRR